MTLPNLLIIGAMSSGTTSLYEYLRGHPQIYMSPVKEPCFFALEGLSLDFGGPGDLPATAGMTADPKAYRALFAGAGPHHIAVGEASAWYIMSEDAPQRIQHHIPDAKLIAILRDPSERAYASFRHLVRAGREPILDFALALTEEERRTREHWDWLWRYVEAGFYFKQLERYFRLFDQRQILLYLYEDLARDANGVVRSIFDFLEVDPRFSPDTTRHYNASVSPRSARVHRFLTHANEIKSLLKPFIPLRMRRRIVRSLMNATVSRPRLPGAVRERLEAVYREDILRLQDLIGRDLSHWLRTR